MHYVECGVDVEEKASRFPGRLVMQYVEALFTNQRDTLLAKMLGWGIRHERRAAREAGKDRDVPTQYQYNDEDYARIDLFTGACPEHTAARLHREHV